MWLSRDIGRAKSNSSDFRSHSRNVLRGCTRMKQLHHGLLPFTIPRSTRGPSCVIDQRNSSKVEHGKYKACASEAVTCWTKQVLAALAVKGIAGMTEPVRN